MPDKQYRITVRVGPGWPLLQTKLGDVGSYYRPQRLLWLAQLGALVEDGSLPGGLGAQQGIAPTAGSPQGPSETGGGPSPSGSSAEAGAEGSNGYAGQEDQEAMDPDTSSALKNLVQNSRNS